MLAKTNRFVCPDCQLQYRLESDFLEHGRVGCKMKGSDRPTFSDKDVEESGDISAAVEQALGEVVVEEEQCSYCKQMFPRPVNLHHSEEDCQANQQAQKPAKPSKKSKVNL